DGLAHDVDPEELTAQLAHEGKLLVDVLLAEVADVEVKVLAVRAFEATPLFKFGDHRAGDDVARPELHLVGHVALQETLALLVGEVTAFATHGFRDEDARERQP